MAFPIKQQQLSVVGQEWSQRLSKSSISAKDPLDHDGEGEQEGVCLMSVGTHSPTCSVTHSFSKHVLPRGGGIWHKLRDR